MATKYMYYFHISFILCFKVRFTHLDFYLPIIPFVPVLNIFEEEIKYHVSVTNKVQIKKKYIYVWYFQIIAREIGTDELRSGSATIVLKIIDMNDNSPIFDPNMKTSLSILENSTSGTELTTLYVWKLTIKKGPFEFMLK